ncbi:MAG TPA: protein kinase [Ktedonobacterales bacterium]|jgi:serine/threonine protein kinase|nr:protein kinase [Ktedonobacterales bacterium]
MSTQQPTVLPQPPALAPGTLLVERYLIQGYIGGGGFGHIYQAGDLRLGYRRAIKEAFCRDQHTRAQFWLECDLLLNARHPNLVRGYATFEQDGRLYLVMDYVDGQTLEDIAIGCIRCTGFPVPEAQVLEWMHPICAAVTALHSQPVPIIHRDVKPANIKLSASLGIPILIDLGLAKLHAAGSQTLAAALAFTPGYAPPEQYQASGATDQRTDIYGLGATLYFLLTGYQPTEAPARLSANALPSPCALNPKLSARSEKVVLRAMALNPGERYQDMRDLAEDLAAARAALNIAVADEQKVETWPRAGQPSGRLAARRIPRPSARRPHNGMSYAPSREARPMPAAAVAAAYVPEQRMPWDIIPSSEREAWASIFALLAVVCSALSLTGAFMRGMLVFLVPALILGHWSLAQQKDRPPQEFRWLAMAALVLSYLWLAICLLALVAGQR